MIIFLELAERAEPIEDIVDDAEFITDEDDEEDDDDSTIMNIDYIIIHRTLLYILNEYKRANIFMAHRAFMFDFIRKQYEIKLMYSYNIYAI